jgi:DNA/RNA endonuclease YhcR with UshA esterase domain
MNKTILATISVLIKDRHNQSATVNDLLTKNGNLIRTRLGVNIEPRCTAGCMAIMSLIVEGTEVEINGLVEKLNNLPEVKAFKTFLI